MADLYAPEIAKALRNQGCIVKSDPTSRYVEEPGRADLLVSKGGRSVAVEVKTGKGGPGSVDKNGKKKSDAGTGFPFDEWRENQRDWAATYCRSAPFSTEYWLAIFIGLHTPNRRAWKSDGVPNLDKNGVQYMPRLCWLVPYEAWLTIEAKILPIQATIPYRVGKGYDLDMQEAQYDAINLLSEWLVDRLSGTLVIPERHVFHRMYLAPEPLPMYIAA